MLGELLLFFKKLVIWYAFYSLVLRAMWYINLSSYLTACAEANLYPQVAAGVSCQISCCAFLFLQTFIDHLLCAKLCYLSWRYDREPYRFDDCLHSIFLVLESLYTFKIWYERSFLTGRLESFKSKLGIKKQIE